MKILHSILCFFGFHRWNYWIQRPQAINVRACSCCGKFQYQIGSPDGKLYWMNT